MDKSLSPSFVRITYTGLLGVHHAIVPINIEDGWVAGVEPNLLTKDGSSVGAIEGVTGYVDAWKNGLAGSQLVGLAEVYAVDADTGEGTFVYGFDLATSGVGGGDGIRLAMATLSLKLINGRTAKITWMDSDFAVNVKVFPPYGGVSPVALMSAYAVSDASIIYGRGNSYPFAPISLTSKTSDASRTRAGLS